MINGTFLAAMNAPPAPEQQVANKMAIGSDL
jgi:hypothetical protein